jgi:hypothetical protein
MPNSTAAAAMPRRRLEKILSSHPYFSAMPAVVISQIVIDGSLVVYLKPPLSARNLELAARSRSDFRASY